MATIKRRIIPVILVLASILILTLQSPVSSQGVSKFVQSIVLHIIDMPWTRDMKMFRTVLHAPLYFLLGLAVGAWREKWWHAAIICVMIALADETLKIFLPTREFGALDLIFDAVGFLIGIGIVWLVRKVKSDRTSI
ncbi:MAG: VanZ family protein [Bulleidia sp.]|nr:VanZ family protein [Bulleidia sp.]